MPQASQSTRGIEKALRALQKHSILQCARIPLHVSERPLYATVAQNCELILLCYFNFVFIFSFFSALKEKCNNS